MMVAAANIGLMPAARAVSAHKARRATRDKGADSEWGLTCRFKQCAGKRAGGHASVYVMLLPICVY